MANKRSKISAARRAQLKALRRKHGLGEFRPKVHVKRGKLFSRFTPRKTTRSFKVAKRKRSSGRSNALGALMKVIVGGFIYGVARQPLQNITKGFLGGVSDEIGMLIVDGVIANFTTGQIRNAALIGAGIEASSLAKNFNIGSIGGNGGNTSHTTNTGIVVIG